MAKLWNNKKLRFIVVCNVIILALCATFFTWARYVINLDGETYLPTAKSFTASIALGESVGVSVDQLLPGASDETNSMTFTILNSKTVEAESTELSSTTVVSETALEYTIHIYSTGNLPLSLTLATEDGSKYIGERNLAVTDGLKEGYQYQFNTVDEDGTDTGLEAVFELDGGTEDQETFTLYFAWGEDSDTASLDNADGMSSHERYQKEVEVIEIRSIIVAGSEQ